ncbi:hypothetical protein POM88_034327 [Heracleum sosnowskyi]|uniref:Uncharacterized protein n=1 Tax=Heracleum sosnowskyi TaxID=360622 RepID=A0AAD8MAG0_9APIA|nr:hypothetical protein POM88_034327 [Heracleum sosnowskyi]
MSSSRSGGAGKERLKWTQELHNLFEKTVNRLGGPDNLIYCCFCADYSALEGVEENPQHSYLSAVKFQCGDANMVEIPVEIETPDHHYYHLAFFTRREVVAYEELTWEYGIDFGDTRHPVKAFKCSCGSKLCRQNKHRKSMSYILLSILFHSMTS